MLGEHGLKRVSMFDEIVRLQNLAEALQEASGQTDPRNRICVTGPRPHRVSSEDFATPATIRISDGSREEHFHTVAAAERSIRERVASMAEDRI